jgi:hypothetical protein
MQADVLNLEKLIQLRSDALVGWVGKQDVC